jgi:GT2 family glycosyltransferase
LWAWFFCGGGGGGGPPITYIKLPENIGFGRANNEGAKIAKGRNLFLLNPDTILLNNAVKILSDYLDSNSRTGCCGGNLFDADKKPTYSFKRFFQFSIFGEISALLLNTPEYLLYGKNAIFNHTEKPLTVAHVTGADLMIRKAVFDEHNGFDPDFFMYLEETELEWRIKKSGYIITSVPDAHIIHLESKSFSNSFDRLEKIYSSRKKYLAKTKSKFEIHIINALHFLNIALHLVIFGILHNKEKIDLWSFIYKTNLVKFDRNSIKKIIRI